MTDTTGELAPELRQLLDRQEIVDLLLRYASTIDAKDYVTLRSLFTEDVRGQYGEDTIVNGADNLLQWIDDMTKTATWQHHMLNVYHVDFVSDDRGEDPDVPHVAPDDVGRAGHVPQDRGPVLRHGAQGRRSLADRRQVHADRLDASVHRRPCLRSALCHRIRHRRRLR